jgi:hypothetical protein
MRAFINRDDVDFSLAAELTPVQEWSLVEDATASVEYATRFSKFQSVSSLTLHFPSNGGAACTRIFFIGLRGEARGVLLAYARFALCLTRICLALRAPPGKPRLTRAATAHRIRGATAAAGPPGARRRGADARAAVRRAQPERTLDARNTRNNTITPRAFTQA